MSDDDRTKKERGQALGKEERNQDVKNMVILTLIICYIIG